MSATRLIWHGVPVVSLAVVLVPPAARLSAQSVATASASVPRCRRDTATKLVQLVLGLTPDLNLTGRERAAAGAIAVRLATFVQPPRRLTIERLRGPAEWSDPSGTYHSDGLLSLARLALELDSSGRTVRRVLDPGTGSVEVDRAILGGVATADSTTAFRLDSTFGPPVSRRVRLWLTTAATPPATWASPLFRVVGRVPAHATPAGALSTTAPVYPPSLRGSHLEGDVVLAFEVDERGGVPDASIRVLRSDHPAFVEPAVRSVRETRFSPATEGGCAVRTAIQQWVHFRAAD